MKIKRITMLERVETNLEPFIKNKCWRLLGANWQKRIEISRDLRTGDIIMRYE